MGENLTAWERHYRDELDFRAERIREQQAEIERLRYELQRVVELSEEFDIRELAREALEDTGDG